MSVESAKAFLKKFSEDSQFKAEFEGKDEEGRRQMVKNAGFEFTKEEIKEAAGVGEGELSDEELENVAGGGVGIATAVAAAVTASSACYHG